MCFDMLMADQQARGQVQVNRARYKLRDAQNEKSATESTVQKWGQSLSNRKKLDAGGRNFGILAENFARRVDANTLGTAMGRLAHGEEIGRLTASAASAGMGGSSVEAFNRTVETSYALQAEMADRAAKSENYLAAQELGRVIPDAIDSMDNNLYMANMDYGYYGSTKGPSTLGTLATIAVAGAATAAGAPEVGKAIMGAKTAGLQSEYGIGDGGAAALGKAMDSFKTGVGEVRGLINKPKQAKTNSFSGGFYKAPNMSQVGMTGGLSNISNGSLGSVTFR